MSVCKDPSGELPGPRASLLESDIQQLFLSREELLPKHQGCSSDVAQGYTEPPCFKEGQEELWSNPEEEEPQGQEEAVAAMFPLNIVTVKGEDEDEDLQYWQYQQRQAEQMETSADGVDWISDPGRHSKPETGVNTGDFSEPDSDDSNDQRESREHHSGLKFLVSFKKKKARSDMKTRSCSVCLKTFKERHNLNRHMKIHEGEKPFSCFLCSKTFTRKESLDKHILVHTGEKPFSCPVCGKRFNRKSSMTRHVASEHQSHTEEKSDTTMYPFNIITVKSEDVEEESQSSQLHDRQTETEGDGKDCGGPEPARNPDPERNLQRETQVKTEASSEAETDDSDVSKQTPKLKSGLLFGGNLENERLEIDTESPLCSVFGETFLIEHHMIQRNGQIPGERPFYCSLCGKRFKRKVHFTTHIKVHSGEKPFSCSVCGKRFSQKSSMTTHMIVHTGEKPFSCPVCSKRFTQKGSMTKHMLLHTTEKPFSCSECSHVFNSESALTLHMAHHRDQKPLSCSVCAKKFSKPEESQHHSCVRGQAPEILQTEKDTVAKTGDDEEDCGEAGSPRNSEPEIRLQPEIEVKIEDSDGEQQNVKERLSGSNSADNTIDQKQSTAEKLHSCPVCQKTFKAKHVLTGHLRVHTGEKPFSCTVCGKTFNQKICLDRHNLGHSGEKPFSCSVCGKRYNRKVNLTTHMFVHTGEKPFSCSACGKSFSRKDSLLKHMEYETGEKPFSCSVCGKRFNQKVCLERHSVVHSGEKPFSCSVCGKAFNRKANLSRHELLHSAD